MLSVMDDTGPAGGQLKAVRRGLDKVYYEILTEELAAAINVDLKAIKAKGQKRISPGRILIWTDSRWELWYA